MLEQDHGFLDKIRSKACTIGRTEKTSSACKVRQIKEIKNIQYVFIFQLQYCNFEGTSEMTEAYYIGFPEAVRKQTPAASVLTLRLRSPSSSLSSLSPLQFVCTSIFES